MAAYLNASTHMALDVEVSQARAKFPSAELLGHALTEEVGELAEVFLEQRPGGKLEGAMRAEDIARDRVRGEALQVACVALRIYEEGDPTVLTPSVQRAIRRMAGLERDQEGLEEGPEVVATEMVPGSILREADSIVSGPRRGAYGTFQENLQRTATIANEMNLTCGNLNAEDVAKILMALKLSRDAFHPKRDNLVDLCGYAEGLAQVRENREG